MIASLPVAAGRRPNARSAGSVVLIRIELARLPRSDGHESVSRAFGLQSLDGGFVDLRGNVREHLKKPVMAELSSDTQRRVHGARYCADRRACGTFVAIRRKGYEGAAGPEGHD